MLISTRTSYSIRAMYELARHYGNNPTSITYISQRQQIPETYLEQLLFSLKGAGLVTGVRGINGGYVLSKEPKDINLTDILKVTEGNTIVSKCLITGDTCSVRGVCPAHNVLTEVQGEIFKHFSGISLQELLDRNTEDEEGI